MKFTRRSMMMSGAALLASAPLHKAFAADYPTRQITLIVPYTAAGGVDAMARVVAQKFSEAFKQQVVVENRPGGGGTIGTRAVTRAAPGTPVPSRSIRRSTPISRSTRARTSKRSA